MSFYNTLCALALRPKNISIPHRPQQNRILYSLPSSSCKIIGFAFDFGPRPPHNPSSCLRQYFVVITIRPDISSPDSAAASRAPNLSAPIYIASAPHVIAPIAVSASLAGANNSILFVIILSVSE
jgi:hypothetical protein